MIRFIKYTHPAAMGYDPNRVYKLDEIKKELPMAKIKVFFTPQGFKWEDLEKKEVSIKK